MVAKVNEHYPITTLEQVGHELRTMHVMLAHLTGHRGLEEYFRQMIAVVEKAVAQLAQQQKEPSHVQASDTRETARPNSN